MLISHFTTLQNKDRFGFVGLRKAKSDKTDESTVDLHKLFFLLDVNMSLCVTRGSVHTKKVRHTQSNLNLIKKLFPSGPSELILI